MNDMDNLRIGKVHSIDEEKWCVRVFFEDTKIMSGWLKVVRTPSRSSLGDYMSPWFPRINDVVICVYSTSFNSDGFVLGAIV